MPRRPCLVCGELSVSGSYCEEHAGAGWSLRPSQSSREAQTREFRVLRPQAIMRDGRRCVRCGSRDELEVHHKRRVADGGETELSNLETLCRICHSREHRFGKSFF